jgi:heterodisulfide reductase subunit B
VNDFFTQPEVFKRIRGALGRPLAGLQPVAYYGCLTQRPLYLVEGGNPENPTTMDRILEILGTSVRPWAYKTECCGGSLGITQPEVTVRLVATLVKAAIEAEANCIVTDCPMCQANLELRQVEAVSGSGELTPLPVFYITELLALAIGVGRSEDWWARHLVDPRPLLRSLGLCSAKSGP